MICPAEVLEGEELENGWHVKNKIIASTGSTGGNFSVCYHVENNDGRKAFLKVLDYNRAENEPNQMEWLNFMTAAYKFEKEVLESCNQKKMSKVVTSIDSGTKKIANYSLNAEYLIFELADGDIRRFLKLSGKFENAWILRSLHNIAVGMNQLHTNGIAHQDLKPSNVLVFESETSKIADLGRAIIKGLNSPHENFLIAGDPTYAPIDLLYGFRPTDWNSNRFGCDLFLLGSLITFYFTGSGVTPSILLKMPRELHFELWTGTFEEILPHIKKAFNLVIDELDKELRSEFLKPLVEMVKQLCEPELVYRGHPQNRIGYRNPYSLERYISSLNIMAEKAELQILGG